MANDRRTTVGSRRLRSFAPLSLWRGWHEITIMGVSTNQNCITCLGKSASGATHGRRLVCYVANSFKVAQSSDESHTHFTNKCEIRLKIRSPGNNISTITTLSFFFSALSIICLRTIWLRTNKVMITQSKLLTWAQHLKVAHSVVWKWHFPHDWGAKSEKRREELCDYGQIWYFYMCQ